VIKTIGNRFPALQILLNRLKLFKIELAPEWGITTVRRVGINWLAVKAIFKHRHGLKRWRIWAKEGRI